VIEVLAHFVLFLALGGVFGFAGGVFGLGGGSIAIPVLGLVFGMSEQLAQGTALVLVVPNVMVGLWNYYRRGAINVRMAVLMGLGAIPSTYVAARIATHLPSELLRVAFAGFVLFIAADLARRTFGRPPESRASARPLWALPLGTLGGAVNGLFSIGGAITVIPFLIGRFGLTQFRAQGMALAFASPSTLIGTTIFAADGDVAWAAAIPMMIGGVLTVSLGVKLAHRLPERRLKVFFMGYLVAVAIALYVKAMAHT
jgi:uncharacterized protein